MQRNILKMALICGIALFLAAAPVHPMNAAETSIDADAQSADDSKLRETYYVTAQNGLKMRSGPTKDSDVITLLPFGAEVTVIGTSNSGWYEIEYANDSGYVAAKYVAKSDEVNSESSSEADESILSTELSSEGMQSSFGAAPIITVLIAAIIIMIILALLTAYSFLKKDKNNRDYGDYADDDNNDDDEYYNDDNEEYNDEYYDGGEYSDEEAYYDDEEYYDDE